ncbi:MAG: aminopeptidase [Gemmatimonadota bacterium]|nr:aminopeptidase [Gemmatimonadota bacterium]
MGSITDAAMNTMAGCMGIKKGETVLVICDQAERRIGTALWEAAKELGAEALLLEIVPRSHNGEEPPPAVAGLMKTVDVVLCPTTKSLTHTEARRAATDGGVRIATLPGITEECMVRCLNADYTKIATLSDRVAAVMTTGSTARVTSPAGTDVTFSIEGRQAHSDTGMVQKPGAMSNLPAGEAYLAPVEGSGNGTIVFEAAVAGMGKLGDEKIRIRIEDGYATEFSGSPKAAELEKLIEPHGRDGFNLAELGIGTNDKAIITGLILEDEKILGTVHLALGDNKSMGGRVGVSSHLDGLVLKPTVWIDEKKIMEAGRLLV